MKEHFYAYEISYNICQMVCTTSEFTEDKMLDILEDIVESHADSLFWILKKSKEQSKTPFSIIDCPNNRIYYHYSGEVEALDETIQKLTQKYR